MAYESGYDPNHPQDQQLHTRCVILESQIEQLRTKLNSMTKERDDLLKSIEVLDDLTIQLRSQINRIDPILHKRIGEF